MSWQLGSGGGSARSFNTLLCRKEKKTLWEGILRSVPRITGCDLPPLADIYDVIPSHKRLKCLQTRTTRLQKQHVILNLSASLALSTYPWGWVCITEQAAILLLLLCDALKKVQSAVLRVFNCVYKWRTLPPFRAQHQTSKCVVLCLFIQD